MVEVSIVLLVGLLIIIEKSGLENINQTQSVQLTQLNQKGGIIK